MLLANPDKIEATVIGLINLYKATTAPKVITVPAVPATGTTPAQPAVTKAPDEAIRVLQKLINEYMPLNKPLEEDGWLGDLTKAAIMQAVVRLRPLLAQLKH